MNSKVAKVVKPILSVEVLDRFYSYIDVSDITIKAYRTGIRKFIAYLKTSNVAMPTREDIVMFK